MMRRQNSSCDQCRKAKRACDAAPLPPVRSSSVCGQEQRATRPCSYCYKTKKHCTRHWAWSQSHNNSSRKGAQSNRRRGLESRTKQPENAESSATELFNVAPLPTAQPSQDLVCWNPAALSPGHVVSRGDGLPAAVQPTAELSYRTAASGTGRDAFFALHNSPIPPIENSPSNHTAFLHAYSENSLEDAVTTNSHCTVSDSSHAYQEAGCPNISTFLDDGPQAAFPTTSRCHSSSDWSRMSGVSLSPFSPQNIMMSKTHNTFMSQFLMHVYHDVFEHSLSCWVSEESCPYNMLKGNRNEPPSIIPVSANPNLALGNSQVQQEWGDVWSNRIYSRVIKLDRAAQMTGIIHLTAAEDQAALRVLHLSIMAFSAQWALNSRQKQRSFSSSPCESPEPDLGETMSDEFDRQMQCSFWWQARKALEECSDIECFRLVCAELIFGLTHRPWDSVGAYSTHDADFMRNNQRRRTTANVPIMSQIQTILSKDGPPIYVERATRKAHNLKYRMDAQVAGLSQASRARLGQSVFDQPTTLSAEDRQTVGLLYWLAVMIDTISASINQRPVVVADRDSQHDATNDNTQEQGNGGQHFMRCSDRRWAIHLFIQDDLKSPTKPIRWPCPYDTAARAVTRSSPVKIILYRHVYYLQDSIQRGYKGEMIEEIIRNAVLVYRYWNTTYGVFFRDLIQNYGTVPTRIQSWFFCILAHWHLAALILADLLELVDEAGLGDSRASQVRMASETVENIRRASSEELADLARIATRPDWTQSMPPQLPSFQLSFNQGNVLSEPCTHILVRAFSRAFAWHFEKAQQENQNKDILGYVGHDVQRIISQCSDCVKALWQLGKKSDTAWNIAEALASALAGLEQVADENSLAVGQFYTQTPGQSPL
ncbi:hypothetical protein GGS21DRAFT_533888 [Xylaria nigripes]|nr:hypothetical protein GGS21DRAFT_533888 [Xylaria nigripes]